MATYGYARVSTGRQANEGESLDVQERSITGYCHMHGLKLDRVFIEGGVSGGKPFPERPQGRKLHDVLRKGDVVIAARLDRMFRSALDAQVVHEAFKNRGVNLHLIDLGGDVIGNGMAKMFFTIVSAFAEGERDRIRERITEVKRDQSRRGRYLGGAVPFGFTSSKAGALVPEPKQQAAITKALRLRSVGKSYREIAAELKKDGVNLSHMGVKRVLLAAAATRARDPRLKSVQPARPSPRGPTESKG